MRIGSGLGVFHWTLRYIFPFAIDWAYFEQMKGGFAIIDVK